MKTKPHILYGWPMSLYSGKTRAYLRYKGIPHREKLIRLWDLPRLRRKVGAQVMPVVLTPAGEWLQDTSHIMDVLEARYPQAPVLPVTPRQRIAALLLECWGDEFWLPSAMHYRWSFAENFHELFQPEGGDHLLPFAPRFVKNAVIGKAAGLMRSYLPLLGVTPAQIPLIERWTTTQCDALDAHFATLPYLLGSRPCLGDFGLIGPLFAHLGRDPYPVRVLMQSRPHLRAWIARMQNPAQAGSGDFLPGDVVPETLTPIFHSIFQEFWPQLQATLLQVQQAAPQLPPGRAYKRSLGAIEFPLLGHAFRRDSAPYSLWMAQRPLDALNALQPSERRTVDAWLASLGGERALQMQVSPRLQRRALHVLPEAA